LTKVPKSHLEVLNIFEGEDYESRRCVIETEDGKIEEALVYVWIGGRDRLIDRDWDYKQFFKERQEEWIKSGDDYFVASSRITA
jgi:gamma-glutamylcyclotransferase (GGCT)/AIG2-like uncharacterized protein YtfP